MPNDAKFGLVVGVGLVITVAVVFFQNAPSSDPTAALQSPAAKTEASPKEPELAEADHLPSGRPVAARTMTFIPSPEPTAEEEIPPSGRRADATPASRRHVLQPGDTLFSLAQRYYSNGDRFIDIYRANRGLLTNPDQLPVGTAIRIP